MVSFYQFYRLGDNVKYGGNQINLIWQFFRFCKIVEVRKFCIDYEYKLFNEEKFREDGLFEFFFVKYLF